MVRFTCITIPSHSLLSPDGTCTSRIPNGKKRFQQQRTLSDLGPSCHGLHWAHRDALSLSITEQLQPIRDSQILRILSDMQKSSGYLCHES